MAGGMMGNGRIDKGLFHIQFTEGKSLTSNAEPQLPRWSLLLLRLTTQENLATITRLQYINTLRHRMTHTL
ncbi:Hypothetical protein SMAX5B_000642 [Scophthalmus maximus]|uniref:Uncharacterized protein n=1 Tax=Scophthalmus maximus TaxID=52904 RepID=A0A2U9B5X7_SCOMX|nr:Hypothetical protein SMAX5B_000642 [Scophthalmus maximus]